MALSAEDAAYIVDQFGIDVSRPLLTQVSRFDPWKDPLGVIDAYRIVRRSIPGVQLALVGSMAHDDPEGWDYYNQTVAYADNDRDIFILSNLNNVGSVEVNAFQVHSAAVIQKSIREGFGLTVAEALWKGRPTVAGRVGGIVTQIEDGVSGWLVGSSEECAAAVLEILADPVAARGRALVGKEFVRRRFLTPAPAARLAGALQPSARQRGRGGRARGRRRDRLSGRAGRFPPVAARRTILVVSNRGPVSYARDDAGERVVRRGGGGLVTALGGLVAHHDVTWIASAMTDEDRSVASERDGAFDDVAPDGSPYRLRLVAHEPAAYDRFYNVVANPTLWFLQHSMWGLAYAPDFDPALHAAWDEGYARVNETFAEATLAELEQRPDAAVFFHDYHLYLAPALVRASRPDVVTSHFVHTPWPQSDYWSVLPEPQRRAVHEGLLANDVVGFHTSRWRRNFLRCCADVLGAEVDERAGTVTHAGRTTAVTAHPIGIDAGAFERLRDDPAVLAREREIVAGRRRHLVLRVDRTDPSKNIVRGFEAFGLFLEQSPELHGEVTMLALLDPSRQDIAEYTDYVAAIEREARAVNERFGRAGLDAGRAARGRRLRAVRRRLQAVRRPAREPGLRRAQPRLEGGSARERARRGGRALRERGLARGARRPGWSR